MGDTGQGPVIIDSSLESPALLWLDKEGYWREPLINFADLGKTPVEIAREIIGGSPTA